MSLVFSIIKPILPEILLLILALLILALDLALPKEQRRILGWVTATGMGLVILLSWFAHPGDQPALAFGGMVSFEWLSYSMKLLVIFGAGITALFAMDYEELGTRGEFYVLMTASTIGMCFMVSAADLVMLYLAIETVSIPLYILAGFFTRDAKSTESGFKYLLFGAMTSAIMLYGFSLLYGFSGETNLFKIIQGINKAGVSPIALIGSLLLVLVGFGFKISAVPLHFWAPDVYEGAPTPVAGFLSTASKAAGFIVLMRVLIFVFPLQETAWPAILTSISVATMTLGNLIALTQRNIKRLLAYSSIAHAGYMLIGVAALAVLPNIQNGDTHAVWGLTSVVYYLIGYLVTNLAAFGVVAAFSRVVGSDDVTAYYGMSRRAPGLALIMMVAFLSLAGMPPLAGFFGKFLVFLAAINANLIALAVIGVLNSIVGLYYYLTVLKYVYLYRSEDEDKPISLTRSYTFALVLLVVGIVMIGTLISPWYNWANTAAMAMFR
jgi:NADH-quinone oxidoreductase subunit N